MELGLVVWQVAVRVNKGAKQGSSLKAGSMMVVILRSFFEKLNTQTNGRGFDEFF